MARYAPLQKTFCKSDEMPSALTLITFSLSLQADSAADTVLAKSKLGSSVSALEHAC